ncbi:MAG: tetratricopeptide repeat protein [Mangrovibacterium sp.]
MDKLLLFVFLFAQLSLRAQPPSDSLENALPKLQREAKAAALNQISVTLRSTDSSRSINYAKQALSLGQSLSDPEIIAASFYNLGESYYEFDEFSQALKFYHAALNIYRELNNGIRIGETCNAIGLVHYFRGEYDLALEKQIEALKNLEKTDELQELAHVYSNIGMVYSRLSDYRVAIVNYRKASVINQQINDLYSVAVNFNGMGVGYYNLGMLDSAKVNYGIALDYFKQIDDRKRVAIGLNNIANIYVDEGDSLQKALDYYEQAFHVFDELNDVRNKTFVMEGLGCVYRAMGDNSKALELFKEGLEVAQANRFGYYIQQLYYKDIAATNESLGRIDEAYSAFKLHKIYLDSLHQEERMRQAAALEKKYESEKKENEIARLSAEREVTRLQMQKDKAIRTFGVIAILLLLVTIVYTSVANFNKKRANQLLAQKNTQIEAQKEELELMNSSKNKFFSIIAHDLKNPLHTIMGYSFLLNREYDRFTDTERRKYAGDIYRSTNNIFRLLQNLLDWSRSQTGRLKYDPVTFEFAQLYERIYHLMKPLAEQKNITLGDEIPDDLHVYADPMMVDTILRNLINNAIKFSNSGSEVMTTVTCNHTEVEVHVKDRGVGMSSSELENLFRIDSKVKRRGTNEEDGSGLGLILCKEFVQINQGSIWAESSPGQGSTFSFTIPMANGQELT